MSKFISRSKKPIEPVWRQKNSAHISEKMNPELLAYLDSLPTELQEKIVVTSSTGGAHAKTSRHYKGAAFDLRIHNRDNPYLDDLFLYFMKDSENRKKNNIVVVDPNHGSAPHIHISVGQGTENELDFAYGNRWDNYIVKGEFKNSKDLWQSAMSNPVYGTLTANRFKDPSYTDAVLAGQPTDYNTSLDHNTSLDYNTDVDYSAFEDNEHRRRVLEELQQYQQLSAEKKIPDVLYDEKVIELLEKQAQRNNAANLIKDFLTLDYEYTNYSAEQPQQTQEVQYAENGGVIRYPNGGKVKSVNEQFLSEFNYSPDEEPVNKVPIPLRTATSTAEKAAIWKYKDELEENYPEFSGYDNLKKILPKRYEALKDSYDLKKSQYVREAMAAKILKDNPYDENKGMDEYLDSLPIKQREIVEGSESLKKVSKSYLDMIEQGLLSMSPMMPVKNPQYSKQEAKDATPLDMIEGIGGYAAKPLQALGNKLGITDFKTAEGGEYDFTDALKGKQNDAGILADIATDLTNYIGGGIGKKFLQLTKVGKFDEASKLLNQSVKATSSVGDVGKGLTQAPKTAWQLEELPGLHLKSTMSDGAISKIVEPKTGLINTQQALSIIAKESGGADKVALIKQGLGNKIPQKMGYNEFRKITQEQLIPLERQFSIDRSNYGIERVGYKNILSKEDYNKQIKYYDNQIRRMSKYSDDGFKKELDRFIKEKEQFINSQPLENQTIILGNKSKFGRGSSAHGNPDETLGHAHFLRDTETPDVLTVTQIQSDAFQNSNHYLNKTKSKLENHRKLLDESLKDTESIKDFGAEDYERMIVNPRKKWIEEGEKELAEALGSNPIQKQLLDKNHQERYLQELVDYAGKRGDVNKVRVPTSETAAKVQGYNKWYDTGKRNTSGEPIHTYKPEHQTILKKYSEQPKTIKKLFGEEPKIVTDSKGNTWYEFDIPKKFKEGKGEIKAFSIIPPTAIGTGAATQNDTPQYPNGGKVNPPIYVDSKNDPRYKSYQDSLDSYNFTQQNLKKYQQTGLSRQGTPIDFSSKKYITRDEGIKNIYNEYLSFSRRNNIPWTMKDAAEEWHRVDASVKNVGAYEFKNNTGSTTTLFDYQKPQQPVKVKPDPAIVAKQQQLIDAGYDIGEADGIWGKRSKEAWEKMQSANQPTKEETTTENTPTEDKKAIVEQYVQNLPKQKPIGYIQVQGRNIPYYTEEELEPFKKYKPTKIGSSNNYAISRHNEKTRGWTSSGELLDENNEVIYKTK